MHNNIAQNRLVYSAIKHRAGVVGNFFFLIPWDKHHDSPGFVFALANFFLQLLQHFWTQNLADLSSYSFLIFTFSLILIEFNIGQDQNKVGDDFPGN